VVHSCESDWKELIAVFLDFKRAFETINRRLLLWKLKQYGVKGAALSWFMNYSSGRTQETRFGEKTSAAKEIGLGVPQGSVLGPLLFILYIDDIKHVLKHCKISLFADDTLIYIASDTLEKALKKMNEDIASLAVWLCHNKLKLNINKTKLYGYLSLEKHSKRAGSNQNW
jgi:hypothetical protein